MDKSTSQCNVQKLHVAIIMDGNGRWAERRGLPRVDGHLAGADAVQRTVEAASELGIGALTLYAFSSDNWKRPAAEVSALMQLFGQYLVEQTPECVKQGIRIEVIGRRDRLNPALLEVVEGAEQATAGGRGLWLRIAVDYSACDSILRAAALAEHRDEMSRERFSRLLGGGPDVDLLIRTGGERRLSDFLLWESAYAELIFTPRMWPDFGRADLESALGEFSSRERRFGGIPELDPVSELV
jgi:undecaprenyl diphosphate synthase